MDDNMKIVDFETYCKKCEFAYTHQDEEPCDTCLSIGARPNSKRPEKYVEARKKHE